MAIRFRKYKNKHNNAELMAIKLTPNNVAEVVAYINKNGGTALDESVLVKSPDLRDGEYLAVKVAVVQKNVYGVGGTKVKKGVRKAFRGDLIVRQEIELPNGKKGYEFSRVRDAGIDGYELV
ncbi:hypothetical protein PBI_CAMILLE_54 [Microbacterium phage Camille]|nr:hypothetical protein PBI_CAMILLE_54 [Microbacterium phage Camille]